MTPAALKDWRLRLNLTAKRAAQELGLSVNGYAAYERGWVVSWDNNTVATFRNPRPIPRHVELACQLLEQQKAS